MKKTINFLFKFLIIPASILFFLVTTLTGCQKDSSKSTLRVGTIQGPDTELLETAKQIVKTRYDLNVEIVNFSDYSTPNTALNDGSIDANMFQTISFLDQQVKQHQYNFAIAGKTFIYPMGIYSKKITKLDALPNAAKVGIPNDPSNEGRALQLLAKAGLITLNTKSQDVNATPTPADVVANPKQLQFVALDAAQLPRTLDDVTIAAINTNFASAAGLIPKRDALYIEGINQPYVNVVVVRADKKDDKRVQQLITALHSDEVKAKAQQLFGEGGAIPAY